VDIDHEGWTQTDHRGAFSLDGLEAGSYRVHVRDFQSGLAHSEPVELATSREITLEVPTAEVSGRVVDATDNQPLAGVSVRLGNDDPQTASRLPTHNATTDLEGRFRIGSVADGQWRLSGSKKGYSAISQPVSVQSGRGMDDLTIRMDPTEGMTIEARLPTGAPAEEIRVAVLDPSGAALVNGNYSTGENGRVRLSSVPPGTWDVVVSAAGSATSNVRAQAPGSTVPVSLQPACTLRVSVPALSQTQDLATVRLQSVDGQPFRSLSWTALPRSEWRMSGGEIEFASLPPGSWTVTVATADGRSWQGTSATQPGSPAELRLE
jgi:5-hydroxyisourate hydrolase-like protein (transthyretin family)